LREEVYALRSDYSQEEIDTLEYLGACVSETLRMVPVFPIGVPKEVRKKGLTVCGVKIPVGSMVNLRSISHHYNDKMFPKPNQFDPRRFMKNVENFEHPKISNVLYMPFAKGTRRCIG